jgi:hypothetical protein
MMHCSLGRFAHPHVSKIAFSPCERFLITMSDPVCSPRLDTYLPVCIRVSIVVSACTYVPLHFVIDVCSAV